MAERRFNWLLILPVLLFLGIAAAALVGLNLDNRDELPSQFQGKPAPALDLGPVVEGVPGTTSAMLREPGLKLVNFWASWCAPCRIEHPFLKQLAERGVPVIGVNYKDKPADAKAFLDELGNPYVAIGSDETGRTGIEWGLYGVPETYLIDGDGTVLARYPGPVTPDSWAERFAPLTGLALD